MLKIEGHLLHKGKEQSIVVRESHIGFDQELEQMKFQLGLQLAGVVIVNDESSSDWSLGLVSLSNDSSYGSVGSVAFIGMVRITANKRTISMKKHFF